MGEVTPQPMPLTSMPDRLDPNQQKDWLNDLKAGIKKTAGSDMNINKKSK